MGEMETSGQKRIDAVIIPKEDGDDVELSADPKGGKRVLQLCYPASRIFRLGLIREQAKSALLEAARLSFRDEDCDTRGFKTKFSVSGNGDVILVAVAEVSRRSSLWARRQIIEVSDVNRILDSALPKEKAGTVVS